jgi:hypothetical protein
MNTLGDDILYRSGFLNRNFLWREFHNLAAVSRRVADSVISLDGHGRGVMANILDGYDEMIKVLEVMLRARDDNTTTIAGAETAKVADFYIKFLDYVDAALVDLLDQARQTRNETNFALNVVDGISTEITKVQGEIATQWKSFRLSRPIVYYIWPWTTVSKIEGEVLQADLAMAHVCRLELQDALEQLASLALDLTAYKVNIDLARDQHHLRKYIGWGDNGFSTLVEVKDLVHQGRKEIGM